MGESDDESPIHRLCASFGQPDSHSDTYRCRFRCLERLSFSHERELQDVPRSAAAKIDTYRRAALRATSSSSWIPLCLSTHFSVSAVLILAEAFSDLRLTAAPL